VFRPAAGKSNGAAMLVLPGGGFGGLAWDLEGVEPAQWLADRGVTAFLLKYRVGHIALAPGQAPPTDIADLLRMMEPGRVLAVADAIQALKVVRGMAGKYGIDQSRVGMMGFSAGAIATLGTVLQAEAAARPNFAVSVYGMPIIATAPAADAPPLFLVHSQDDPVVPVTASSKLFEQWQSVHRPVEAHLYSKGGHGFGMRMTELPVGQWPEALHAWLKSQGLLEQAAVR
jgi:acetyl esterase/lipase